MSRVSGETAVHQSSNAPKEPRALAAYPLTRSDRRGPDAALLYRVVPYMIVIFACCTVLFSVLGVPLILGMPLAAGLAGAFVWGGLRFATLVGNSFAHFVLPSGKSTPYEHQFSREESLAARGDIAGALEELEAGIAATPIADPAGINVRLRAAELYMGKGNDPKRAAALFREIQRFPALSASQDVYVSNRLIDLLLGPLRQPNRALVELRRIIDRYPNSAVAAHSRAAIVTIKRQLSEEGPSSG